MPFWKNVEKVHYGIGAFIGEYRTLGTMPTRKQLYEFGRTELENASMGHGGLWVIEKQMGLRGRKDVKPRGSVSYTHLTLPTILLV